MRFTSLRVGRWCRPVFVGEANLTLAVPRVAQKPWDGLWGTDHIDPCPTDVSGEDVYWSRYISATRKARSSDWLRLSRGSQAVS